MSGKLQRGIVKIKPVYVGIYHYLNVYGSVCSPDVIGTPPVPSKRLEELENEAQKIVERFKERINVDFVEVEKPFVIKDHKDLRRFPWGGIQDKDDLTKEIRRIREEARANCNISTLHSSYGNTR